MPNQLSVFGGLSYSDSIGQEQSLYTAQDDPDVVSVATEAIARMTQNIGTSEEALNLGNIATLGYIYIKNLDETNFVQLRTATSGTYFCKLKPGEIAVFRFGSGVTAPYAIADTAACDVEYFLISN